MKIKESLFSHRRPKAHFVLSCAGHDSRPRAYRVWVHVRACELPLLLPAPRLKLTCGYWKTETPHVSLLILKLLWRTIYLQKFLLVKYSNSNLSSLIESSWILLILHTIFVSYNFNQINSISDHFFFLISLLTDESYSNLVQTLCIYNNLYIKGTIFYKCVWDTPTFEGQESAQSKNYNSFYDYNM